MILAGNESIIKVGWTVPAASRTGLLCRRFRRT